MKQVARNIRVEFAGERVTLSDPNDSKETASGVTIYVKARPGGGFQPFALIPDGTLDRYKHNRPTVEKVDWVVE